MALQSLSVAQDVVLAWVPVSPRLASARLKGVAVNLTVAAVDSPTLEAAKKEKNCLAGTTEPF